MLSLWPHLSSKLVGMRPYIRYMGLSHLPMHAKIRTPTKKMIRPAKSFNPIRIPLDVMSRWPTGTWPCPLSAESHTNSYFLGIIILLIVGRQRGYSPASVTSHSARTMRWWKLEQQQLIIIAAAEYTRVLGIYGNCWWEYHLDDELARNCLTGVRKPQLDLEQVAWAYLIGRGSSQKKWKN